MKWFKKKKKSQTFLEYYEEICPAGGRHSINWIPIYIGNEQSHILGCTRCLKAVPEE